MNAQHNDESIRVLIADDDEHVLECYRSAFCETSDTTRVRALDVLSAELFDSDGEEVVEARFDVVECRQGEDAIELAAKAAGEGHPFDVVILDVRMPPGIDGVEAGSRIRRMDPDVEIIFVSGYSDVPRDELERRVPPPMRLHCFKKPLSFSRLAKDVVSLVQAH